MLMMSSEFQKGTTTTLSRGPSGTLSYVFFYRGLDEFVDHKRTINKQNERTSVNDVEHADHMRNEWLLLMSKL